MTLELKYNHIYRFKDCLFEKKLVCCLYLKKNIWITLRWPMFWRRCLVQCDWSSFISDSYCVRRWGGGWRGSDAPPVQIGTRPSPPSLKKDWARHSLGIERIDAEPTASNMLHFPRLRKRNTKLTWNERLSSLHSHWHGCCLSTIEEGLN